MKTRQAQSVCFKCQEILPIDNFGDFFNDFGGNCESCNLFDARLMIAYKRELTGDLQRFPYFA